MDRQTLYQPSNIYQQNVDSMLSLPCDDPIMGSCHMMGSINPDTQFSPGFSNMSQIQQQQQQFTELPPVVCDASLTMLTSQLPCTHSAALPGYDHAITYNPFPCPHSSQNLLPMRTDVSSPLSTTFAAPGTCQPMMHPNFSACQLEYSNSTIIQSTSGVTSNFIDSSTLSHEQQVQYFY